MGEGGECAGVGVLDANDPRLAITAVAFGAYFSSDVDEEVEYALALKPLGKNVDGIALGDAAEVELYTGVGFSKGISMESDFMHAKTLQQAVG